MGVDEIDPDAARLEARLVDAIQQAVIATDLAGKVIFWNTYAERMFGWRKDEALGQSIVELTPHENTREQATAIMDRLAGGGSWAGEFPVRRKDGTSFVAFVVNSPVLDAAGQLVGVVGVSTDVSEQRALEEQLRQSKKMEAIGRLAGGVAHDFNNLLTVILGNVELVTSTNALEPDAMASLDEVRDAAARAASLTRQLLTFSRKQFIRPVALDLVAAVRSMAPMLRRLIGEDVEVVLEVGERRLSTLLDAGQFDQIILNLALNARDAMPTGGRLVFHIDSITGVSTTDPPTATGQMLRVSVSDTGTGIPPDVLPHIFEPFFTTKAGTGTGLGLATVYGIVEQAGGTIEMASSDRGTTFHIFLPRTTACDPDALTKPGPASFPTRRTILLVEDERALRTLATRVLTSAGFEVLAREHGPAALQAARSHSGPIDLLLTDMVMPGINGLALMQQVRTIRPNIAVLLMTGYGADDLLRRGTTLPQIHLLQKPFVPKELLAAVSNALLAPE